MKIQNEADKVISSELIMEQFIFENYQKVKRNIFLSIKKIKDEVFI